MFGKFREFLAKHSNIWYFLALSLIILLGLLVRVIGLNKLDGFWHDETLSFSLAKEAFPFGILHKLYIQDFHAPLYYFFLSFWTNFVQNNEILIRFSSVIFGVLALPVFYFIGKELDSRKTGLYIALLASINSCLIYYSQEVRFYSPLVLFSALVILFMIKIKKTGSKGSCIALAVTNLLILYTYTMGSLFIFLELLFMTIYLFLVQRKTLKPLLIAQAAIMSLYIPYIPFMIHYSKESLNTISGIFWWITFSFTTPILVFQDWFTPVLINIRSNPINYYDPIFKQGLNPYFTIFILIPMVIYLIGIIKTAFQKNFAGIILGFGFAYFVVELIMAWQGKLGLMTRYAIIILPVMITAAGYGISKIKNKYLSVGLISIISVISLFYILFSPISAPKMPRDGYHKYIVELEKQQPNENDIVIIPYGGRFFGNYYLNHKATVLPFDIELMYVLNKKLETILDKDTINAVTPDPYKNKALFRNYIGTNEPAPELAKYVKENITNKLKKNGRVFIIISGGIDQYKPSDLSSIVANDYYYLNIPIFTMLSSKTINDLLMLNDRNLQFINKQDYRYWQMYIYKKS